jgi:N-acetylglucosaminyl-diphospho-decaprenol L-rhamnosyltransferase
MISTVTVNYKTADYLERMLTSLFAHHQGRAIEVFVVENNSGDDLSALQKMFPQVTFLFSKKNLGFAGGCNLAIKKATGEYVLLLNPDVIFDNDALYQIESSMDRSPDVGIGGISLKNLDGTLQKCVWRFPRPSDQFLLLCKLHHLFPNLSSISRWRFDDFNSKETQDVEQVMGAFFCIRRDVLKRIGLLDDGFFMWYEEVDFCQRAITGGWRVRFFSNIHVRHKRGSSFDRVRTLRKQNILRKSIRRYMKKHYGNGAWLVFVVCEPLFLLMGLIASLVKPI